MGRIGKIFREGLVKNIKKEVSNNSSTFLISCSSISATKMDTFRKDLHRMGAKVCVSRNQIARLALGELSKEKLANDLKGQTAFVWSNEDTVAISKALTKFAQDCEGMTIQGGVLDGGVLGKDDVKRLSDLPAKAVLQTQLLTTMLAPLTRLAGAMNAKTRDLLSILKQLSEKKGGN
jgi:large subunit ribosomal protein L10